MLSKRPQFETAQCPVCKAIFGQRELAAIYKAHCKECRAIFYWKPWADEPSVVMDSARKARRYCTKDGCVCRD